MLLFFFWSSFVFFRKGSDTVLFVVDATLSQDNLAAVMRCVAEAVRSSSSRSTRVGLISFDNTVQLHLLDSATLCSAVCVPAVRGLNAEEQDYLSSPILRAKLLVPIEELNRTGALQSTAQVIGNSSVYSNNVRIAQRERGLGAALAVAGFIGKPLTESLSRTKVVFVCGGPPNLYPVAHAQIPSFWEDLSLSLSRQIHSLEPLFVSVVQCNVETFLPKLMLHVGGSPASVPVASKNACPDFERAVTTAFSQFLRPLVYGGVMVSVRTQSNLSITHIVGPTLGVDNKPRRLPLSGGCVDTDSLAIYFDHKLSNGPLSIIQVLCSFVDLQKSRLCKRLINIPFWHVREMSKTRVRGDFCSGFFFFLICFEQ